MATIRNEFTVRAPVADVWAALRDFGAVHRRLASGFVVDARLEGDARDLTFFDGGRAREVLVGVDDEARRLAYRVVEGRLRFEHHSASAQVFPDGSERTRFVWISDVLPHELGEPIARMMDLGQAAIHRTLEASASGPGPGDQRVDVPQTDWEERVAAVWASIDRRSEEDFLTLVESLASELPEDNAIAAFERASAFDSTGHPDLAVPLYRQGLERGLTGERRRRAVIQLASSLRNLDQPHESVELLAQEMNAGSDNLDDAVRAVLALALADVGREREALTLVIAALARHLPRYQSSMANYARLLATPKLAADPLPGRDR
jgi:tetratricopeptide (TPR) repeat protein